MSKPAFRVIAKQPFVEQHGDAAGRTLDDVLYLSTDDRTDALTVAKALRAQGWSTEIRQWTRRQRRVQDRLGRWGWRAGFVEVAA